MSWYTGPTLLEALDAFTPERPPRDRALRMPVQEVYKFTARGDTRRIVAGTIEAGTLRVGDDVVFLPSGKRARVRSIEGFNRPPARSASAGAATGFTLEQQIYVTRGELVTRAGDPPPAVATRLSASVFWLGRRPLTTDRDYLLKLGTARVKARLESVERVIDAATLASIEKPEIARHDVAECTLRLARPIALDPVERSAATGRFVLVDGYEISGGGIVRQVLPDAAGSAAVRAPRAMRPSSEQRAARHGQRPTLLLVAAADRADAEAAAASLEARLFDEGRLVSHITVDGADALATASSATDALLELGAIVIVTAGADVAARAAGLADRDGSRDGERAARVWLGAARPIGFAAELELPSGAPEETADALRQLLRERRSVPGV
jgi:bifunctional enzyme CysN/CysC